ncbi:MAG: aminodeoxychorismate/anthranilate synthase component II [Patescibacteria group bacterium]
MRTLILDNYDSFTYNLYQYVAELGGHPVVKKNDEISLRQIEKIKPTHIIISPGPGTPTLKKDFGLCTEVIKKYAGKIPILGVCLGHQGIIYVFGGKIKRAPKPVHGKTSEIKILCGAEKISHGCKTKNIFHGLAQKIKVMRYHSLIGDEKSLPKELAITAKTAKDGLIMAIQHKKFSLYGIQFHPESFETPSGKKIIKNFLMSRATAR